MQMGNQEFEGKKLWKILAFHVHSDHNPGMKKLAGERLTAVMDNKNDDAYLTLLAKKWGIPVPEGSYVKNETIVEWVTGWSALFTSNLVDILFNKKHDKIYLQGFIVDFKRDSDGVKVYICTLDDIIKVVYIKEEHIEILRTKKRDEANWEANYHLYLNAKKVYNAFLSKETEKRKKKEAKEKRDKLKELFKKVGLKPITNYKYYGLRMDYNGIWYDVIRTTTNKVILAYMGIEIKISIENANKVYA